MSKKENPSRNIFIVSFFTALSRILGLIRDMLFSRLIGISYVADAFFIALRLPNIFRRITAEGAFSASFIARRTFSLTIVCTRICVAHKFSL